MPKSIAPADDLPATNADERDDPGASQTVRALLGLRQMILDGELAPGSRISEPALAVRLAVSRTPIRSALARLADEGLLSALPTSGYAVQAFTEADISDAIEARGTLEGLAARLAAERGASDRILAGFQHCLDDIDGLLQGEPDRPVELDDERFLRYIELNTRFHQLLAQACAAPVIQRLIERAQSLPFASPNGFVRVQANLPGAHRVLISAQEQHRSIVEAIRHREGSRAEALAREHARIAHRNLRTALNSRDALALLPGASLIQENRGR